MTQNQQWLMGLTCLMGSVLMACSGGGTMAREAIDLQHLVTPAGLMVQNREVYEMVQETGNSGPGLVFDDLSQLEDEERQEVETFFGQLPERMQQIEERTIEIRDEVTIDVIFDALRTAAGEYVNDDEAITSWLESDFYYIRVAYDDEAINQRGYAMDYWEQLQEGYVFYLYVLEDDRLFFSDGKMNDEGGQGLVTVPFDFQWFEGLIH